MLMIQVGFKKDDFKYIMYIKNLDEQNSEWIQDFDVKENVVR